MSNEARVSNSQIDAIGEVLRRGGPLDEFQEQVLQSFLIGRDDALATVVAAVSTIKVRGARLSPAARVKTRGTTVEKLQRERARLTQIQDIAGARIVLQGGLGEQDDVVKAISDAFVGARVFDRRLNPSFGYRAVHVVVKQDGRPVEIQVRTHLQHRWAEIYERLADQLGRGIRYGVPLPEPVALVDLMQRLSDLVAVAEEYGYRAERLRGAVDEMPQATLDPAWRELSEMERAAYDVSRRDAEVACQEAEQQSKEAEADVSRILETIREQME